MNFIEILCTNFKYTRYSSAVASHDFKDGEISLLCSFVVLYVMNNVPSNIIKKNLDLHL
ncbi:hypothetical protein [Clostridium hydrogenum]|uniref:hypothetical protein n=1 Tax=Clostridium hydrogenum TaxID=2855764 RepID=UPI001F43B16B|nr:hypothetical protein [Clostridium hydrogenum]